MKSLISLFFVGVTLAANGLGQTPTPQSGDEVNLGVKAYRGIHYAEAVEHFKNAVTLDPANVNAQLYLATAYMIQWVPGGDVPENAAKYQFAKQAFEKVLHKDPNNSAALSSMASMAYNSAVSGTKEQKAAALEDAKKWNQRRVDVDPKNAEGRYMLGVVAWAEAFPDIQSARVNAGMLADEPGPIPNQNVREQLVAKYWKTINGGLGDLKACLGIDEENEDAMTYMNLLYRKKADLEDSSDAAKADVAQAEEWVGKALEMKRIKATRPLSKPER